MSRNSKRKVMKSTKDDDFNMSSLTNFQRLNKATTDEQDKEEEFILDGTKLYPSLSNVNHKYTFLGSLKERFNVMLIHNVYDDAYANNLLKLLKRIKYNSDEESMIKIYGMKLKIPRKQVAFGNPDSNYHLSGTNVKAIDWNKEDDSIQYMAGRELHDVCRYVETLSGGKYNYVLINRYIDGKHSIGWHSDDEKELGKYPLICGLSLGQERQIYFRSNITGKVKKVTLPHNSLFVMYYPTNSYWQHSIPKTSRPMTDRISLTFRSVT